ncbi:O-antigen ligase family protein [Gloeocapsopsis sp. IPPAS B-1203]|uniref:O-antigen ligase family protein n=1 Tax=Gloeocapsopsis sp. IPPAS B-1203 TaxID=2049454 RepID=UPI000C1880D2|nr:O-antigen ligase family protein [Gloeocapsopsis sp. IPPAS B-1203]PIG94125.1 polymerase [Gloeocapsopsis sp. IPPAS B-1203]
MLISDLKLPSSRLAFWVSIGGVAVGIVAGFLAGAQPLYLGLAIVAVVAVIYFFADFERAVLGLLILRSSLDIFSAQQIPAAFAIGVDALTLLYVTVQLLTHQSVQTDRFWWFFAGWVALQGLWVILLPLGGLGLDASVLPDSIREWVRIFSWLAFYLLVMQLQGRVAPNKIISLLFVSLIVPVTVALLQMFVPSSLLPPLLSTENVSGLYSVEGANRIKGTLGHPSGLATYLLLFIGLTYWKLKLTKRSLPLLILLGLLVFVFVGSKSLSGLAMLGTFVLVATASQLKLKNAIAGILLLVIVLGLFISTPFGQERLNTFANTPLFNPNIDVSRAILLSRTDLNSFNWRLAQWTFLLQSWQNSPFLGHGLSTSHYLSVFHNYAHNDYIRALVEEGIVGLIAFLAFLGAQFIRLVYLLRTTPQNSPQRNLCFILLAILISMLVAMATDNIWRHTPFFFYWWSVFAVAGWNWNQQPANNLVAINSRGTKV